MCSNVCHLCHGRKLLSIYIASHKLLSSAVLNVSIPDREIESRRDLRKLRVFTIDPDSTKDLDDALSIQKNDDGSYDIGVHIADVSYFVKANSAMDRDARKRATSVYLVQRSVPMLPPTLSEQLCSLVPNQDRLAFSVVFTLSEEGRLIKKWFGKTIIKCVSALRHLPRCGLFYDITVVLPRSYHTVMHKQ